MAGLFGWFFKRSNREAATGSEARPHFRLTSGGFFEVVGEASYQKALEEICGGRDFYSAEHQCRAFLVPEPTNPHDPNAVQVLVQERQVGYLARQHAVEYHKHLGPIVTYCDAKIVGGWDDGKSVGNFGIKLKIKWPPKIAKERKQ